MYCKKCGNIVKEGELYCLNCGNFVEENTSVKNNNNVNMSNENSNNVDNVNMSDENQKNINNAKKDNKLIFIIIGVVTFFVILVIFLLLIIKNNNRNINGSDYDMTTTKKVVITTKDNAVNNDAKNVSSNWKEYQVTINGKQIQLPCSYKELSDATGFNMKSSQEKSYLEKGYYSLVNLYKNDKLALYTEIVNDTESDIKYSDGKVSRISQTKYQVENTANYVVFPGNLKVGEKITKDEILKKYGTPTKIDNYSNSGYISDTFRYNADSTYTTINYFNIKVVNGIIDEITLDHRKY